MKYNLKLIFLICLVGCSISSCGNRPKKQQEKLNRIEQQVQDALDSEIKDLLQEYYLTKSSWPSSESEYRKFNPNLNGNIHYHNLHIQNGDLFVAYSGNFVGRMFYRNQVVSPPSKASITKP